MWTLQMFCFSLLFNVVLSCYECLHEDTSAVCQKFVFNAQICDERIKTLFSDPRVIEAGKVDPGYYEKLKEILNEEVEVLTKETGKYEDDTRLRTLANNFVAKASKLPSGHGCVPPCGFQPGGTYDCVTCKYETCKFPIDCPVKQIRVAEFNRTKMWCDVSFPLPKHVEMIWRFADNANTQLMSQFKEVTRGADPLFSIPLLREEHQGTYQCDILSQGLTIARVYYFLKVVPRILPGHKELQRIFDLSMIPGGELLVPEPVDTSPPFYRSNLFLFGQATLTFTALLLSTWCIVLWTKPEDCLEVDEDDDKILYHQQDAVTG